MLLKLFIKEKLIDENTDVEKDYTHQDILNIIYENRLENRIFVINDNIGLCSAKSHLY